MVGKRYRVDKKYADYFADIEQMKIAIEREN